MVDGTVIPVLICSKAGCNFARLVKLIGWDDPNLGSKFFAMPDNPLGRTM